MNAFNQKLYQILTLTSLIFFATGCMPKNANGTYNSAYSYHPYNQDQSNSYKEPYSSYSNIANKIEKDSLSLVGTDYQYGANGPDQYDCSSFTKYVFSKQGITLPRVSREQAKQGRLIRKGQLQKGDLVFFDSQKSSSVSHVGIYLGRGDFIHASSSQKKVTISNLSSNYYAKHFKWGRRVANVKYAMR